MKARIRNQLKLKLPLYVNGTLRLPERLICNVWLRFDADARAQLDEMSTIGRALASQPYHAIPADSLASVQRQIVERALAEDARESKNIRRPSVSRISWAVPVFLALLAIVIVWYALPPAISLEWSVIGEQPSEFRVYRARLAGAESTEAADFQFLNEVEAGDRKQAYTFTDLQLLPGQRYLYRVDAVDSSGKVVRSNTTIADSVSVLPGQLVLLATVLVLAYAFYIFIGQARGGFLVGGGPGTLAG